MTTKCDSYNHVKSNEGAHIFAEYARYYNLLYKDKDYAAEAEYVAGLIRRFHPSARTILELGSGTGIHASLLAEKGFAVHGIERSQEMLQHALEFAQNRQHKHSESSLVFTEGDIRTVILPQTFDAVVALFHVMSYQTANEDVLATFATARKHLRQEGVFLFDVWYGPSVLAEKPSIRIKRMADVSTKITRIAEPVMRPNANLVEVHYHIFMENCDTGIKKELKEIHSMRYFFVPEIEMIATQNGLQVIRSEEWISGAPLGDTTWSACFLLQAKPK